MPPAHIPTCHHSHIGICRPLRFEERIVESDKVQVIEGGCAKTPPITRPQSDVSFLQEAHIDSHFRSHNVVHVREIVISSCAEEGKAVTPRPVEGPLKFTANIQRLLRSSDNAVEIPPSKPCLTYLTSERQPKSFKRGSIDLGIDGKSRVVIVRVDWKQGIGIPIVLEAVPKRTLEFDIDPVDPIGPIAKLEIDVIVLLTGFRTGKRNGSRHTAFPPRCLTHKGKFRSPAKIHV